MTDCTPVSTRHQHELIAHLRPSRPKVHSGSAQPSLLQAGHDVTYSGASGQPADVHQVIPGRRGILLPHGSIRHVGVHEVDSAPHILQV